MKKTLSIMLAVAMLVSALAVTTANAVGQPESLPTGNLLENGSFENGSIAPFTAGNCSLTVINDANAQNGSKVAKATNRTANYAGFQYDAADLVWANGSGTYHFSFYAKLANPSAPAASMKCSVQHVWTNSTVETYNGTTASGTYPYESWGGLSNNATKTVDGNAWVEFSCDINVDLINALQPLRTLQLYFTQTDWNSSTNKPDILFDNISLVKKANKAYNDGNKNVAEPVVPAINADGSVTHADGKVLVNEPNLVYTGRWNKDFNNVYYTGWQGYVEMKFTGTTTLKNIANYEGTVFGSEVYVEIIDENGNSILPPVLPALGELGRYMYITDETDLTAGLITLDPAKVYTVRLIARWSYYRMVFQGFKMDANAKTLPMEDTPSIQFIGDSITEGYINVTYTSASSTAYEGKQLATTNTKLAGMSWTDSYSYLTGKKLGWRASAVGRSSIAMALDTKELMPQLYKTFSIVTKEPYDISKDEVDYISICLGTNDRTLAKTAAGKQEFYDDYVAFLDDIFNAHPSVVVFMVLPFCSCASDYAFIDEIKKIESTYTKGTVVFVDTSDWGLSTENATIGNPYIATDSGNVHLLPAGAELAATKLAAFIKDYDDNHAHQTTVSVTVEGSADVEPNDVFTLADDEGNAIEGVATADGIVYTVNANNQYTLTAADTDDYKAASIAYASIKGSVTKGNEIKFTAYGNGTDLVVKYVDIESNDNVVTLNYENYVTGSSKVTTTYAVIDIASASTYNFEENAPELYNRYVTSFKIDGVGEYNSNQLQTFFAGHQQDSYTVTAVYTVGKTPMDNTVTISAGEGVFTVDGVAAANGDEVNQYALVKFIADEEKGGVPFYAWEDASGKEVSYNTEYTVYALTDLSLNPVYANDERPKAAVSISMLDNDHKLVVKAERSCDEGEQIVEHGILISEVAKYSGDKLDLSKVGTYGDKHVYIASRNTNVFNNGTYVVTKSGANYTKNTVLYYRAYVKLADGTVIYSDPSRATVIINIETQIEFDEVE